MEPFARGTRESIRPDLGGARVVEGARAPGILYSGPDGDNRRPRLPCMDRGADAHVARRDPFGLGHLDEPQSVRRRAYENGRLGPPQELKTSPGVESSPGNGQSAEPSSAGVSAPEPDKRAEREGEEYSIARAHARCAVHIAPALGPPVPALCRVEDH